jgi:hypothetical protein
MKLDFGRWTRCERDQGGFPSTALLVSHLLQVGGKEKAAPLVS